MKALTSIISNTTFLTSARGLPDEARSGRRGYPQCPAGPALPPGRFRLPGAHGPPQRRWRAAVPRRFTPGTDTRRGPHALYRAGPMARSLSPCLFGQGNSNC